MVSKFKFILAAIITTTTALCCESMDSAIHNYYGAKENYIIQREVFKTTNANLDDYLTAIKEYKLECLHILYIHKEGITSSDMVELEDILIDVIDVQRKIKQIKNKKENLTWNK